MRDAARFGIDAAAARLDAVLDAARTVTVRA
jgi:hypothetical protein